MAERDDKTEGFEPEPDPIHRENVPGELDHASGEVDRVEAEIVAGAGGEPLADDPDDVDEDELADEVDAPAVATTGGPGKGVGSRAIGEPTTSGGGPRFLQFLKACWAELQRVQWPDRRQVGQATAVVIGFVIIAGLYLGLADRLASELVDLII